MPQFQMQIDTAHPVLFLSDPAAIGSALPDTGAAFVTHTDDCLAFWVLAYVDGASLVTISDSPCDSGGTPLFEGQLRSPSGVIALSDSSNFRYINVPVAVGRLSVTIWAEHQRHPEWVWLQLDSIKPV